MRVKYGKDHAYMKRLDKILKQFSVVKVAAVGGAHHGEDFEEMKQLILDALLSKAVDDKTHDALPRAARHKPKHFSIHRK